MLNVKQAIEEGVKVGSTHEVITNGATSICMVCGASTQEGSSETGTVLEINRTNFGIKFQWNRTYQCGCCGNTYDNSWIYEPGYWPKTPEPPKCSVVQPKKIAPDGTLSINTDGAAYHGGSLDVKGDYWGRDQINVNGMAIEKRSLSFGKIAT